MLNFCCPVVRACPATTWSNWSKNSKSSSGVPSLKHGDAHFMRGGVRIIRNAAELESHVIFLFQLAFQFLKRDRGRNKRLRFRIWCSYLHLQCVPAQCTVSTRTDEKKVLDVEIMSSILQVDCSDIDQSTEEGN